MGRTSWDATSWDATHFIGLVSDHRGVGIKEAEDWLIDEVGLLRYTGEKYIDVETGLPRYTSGEYIFTEAGRREYERLKKLDADRRRLRRYRS